MESGSDRPWAKNPSKDLWKQTFLTYHSPTDWYFRIKGYGLSIQPDNHFVLFSQRQGWEKHHHKFGICWRILGRPYSVKRRGRAKKRTSKYGASRTGKDGT